MSYIPHFNFILASLIQCVTQYEHVLQAEMPPKLIEEQNCQPQLEWIYSNFAERTECLKLLFLLTDRVVKNNKPTEGHTGEGEEGTEASADPASGLCRREDLVRLLQLISSRASQTSFEVKQSLLQKYVDPLLAQFENRSAAALGMGTVLGGGMSVGGGVGSSESLSQSIHAAASAFSAKRCTPLVESLVLLQSLIFVRSTSLRSRFEVALASPATDFMHNGYDLSKSHASLTICYLSIKLILDFKLRLANLTFLTFICDDRRTQILSNNIKLECNL